MVPPVAAPSRDELRARIADRVREQAARRRITLDRLAADAKVSRTALYNVTTGRGGVTIDTLLKLGQALDVDPVTFLRPYKDRPAAGQTDPVGAAPSAEKVPPARKAKRRSKTRGSGAS